MTMLNTVLISFTMEGLNHMGGLPVTIKIEASRLDATTLLDTIISIVSGHPFMAPAPGAGPVPSPAKTGTKGENVAQPGAGSAAAAPAAVAQKKTPVPVAKPKKERVHYPTLAQGTQIKYINPENKGFFGKTGTVILNRGAMTHLNFGKDGTCWGHRKYCEVVPAASAK